MAGGRCLRCQRAGIKFGYLVILRYRPGPRKLNDIRGGQRMTCIRGLSGSSPRILVGISSSTRTGVSMEWAEPGSSRTSLLRAHSLFRVIYVFRLSSSLFNVPTPHYHQNSEMPKHRAPARAYFYVASFILW